MIRLGPAALGASGLLERAIAVLEASRTGRPDDPSLLRRLLNLYRQTGDLDRAANIARVLATAEPDDLESAYVASMLAGGPAHREARGWPANFLRLRGYLDPERYEDLLARLATSVGALASTPVVRAGHQLIATDSRRSTSTPDIDAAAVTLAERIAGRVAEWCDRLGLPRYRAEATAVKLTRYQTGDFFRRHRDDSPGANRPLGFIYYLQFPGHAFEGGELLVHDTHDDGETIAATWSSVRPEPNSLVILPSEHWHEVAPVRGAGEGPLAGRFTLNGWLARAADDGVGAPPTPAR